MSLNKLLFIGVAAWAILVLATLSARLALFAAAMNPSEILGWLLIGSTPAVVALVVVRSRPAPSVAQVIYDVEHTAADAASLESENNAQR